MKEVPSQNSKEEKPLSAKLKKRRLTYVRNPILSSPYPDGAVIEYEGGNKKEIEYTYRFDKRRRLKVVSS